MSKPHNPYLGKPAIDATGPSSEWRSAVLGRAAQLMALAVSQGQSVVHFSAYHGPRAWPLFAALRPVWAEDERGMLRADDLEDGMIQLIVSHAESGAFVCRSVPVRLCDDFAPSMAVADLGGSVPDAWLNNAFAAVTLMAWSALLSALHGGHTEARISIAADADDAQGPRVGLVARLVADVRTHLFALAISHEQTGVMLGSTPGVPLEAMREEVPLPWCEFFCMLDAEHTVPECGK
jgi:hypothetical protein